MFFVRWRHSGFLHSFFINVGSNNSLLISISRNCNSQTSVTAFFRCSELILHRNFFWTSQCFLFSTAESLLIVTSCFQFDIQNVLMKCTTLCNFVQFLFTEWGCLILVPNALLLSKEKLCFVVSQQEAIILVCDHLKHVEFNLKLKQQFNFFLLVLMSWRKINTAILNFSFYVA